jgi:hypothetical protein
MGWLNEFSNEELNQASNTDNQILKCLPRCESQTETPTFTSSVFPIKSTFFQQKYFCIALEKVARICSDKYRAKIFELAYNDSKISCLDILNVNNAKKTMLKPNAAKSQYG